MILASESFVEDIYLVKLKTAYGLKVLKFVKQ